MTTQPLDRTVGADPLTTTLARLAVVVRFSVAPFATVAVALTAGDHQSTWATVVALVAFDLWTMGYLVIGLVRGFDTALAVADAALTGLLLLCMEWITLPDAPTAGSGWLAHISSIVIVTVQFAGRPRWTVSAGAFVIACYVAGARFAQAPDRGLFQTFTLCLQLGISAAMLAVLRRTVRGAEAAAQTWHGSTRAQEVERLRRDSERHELTLLDNGPLTTLTLIATGELTPTVAASLRTQAKIDLVALRGDAASTGPGGADAAVLLDDLLDRATATVRDRIAVELSTAPCRVPRRVGEALTSATVEALENVARNAGTGAATVHVGRAGAGVTVTITDTGRGFDPAGVPLNRFGLRESITGALARVGGRAEITTAPGAGTTVLLRWPR